MAGRFRRIGILLVILALLAAAGAAGVLWLARSPDALRWAAGRIEAALGGRLQLHGLSGSLARAFMVERATFEKGGVRIELQDLRIEWSLRALLSRAVDISSLEIRHVDVRVVPSGNEIVLPASLALPVDIRADSVGVGEVQVRVGSAAPLQFRDLSLAYRGGRSRHDVRNLSVRSPWGPMAGRLRMGAQADFPVDGALAWTMADLPVDGQARGHRLRRARTHRGAGDRNTSRPRGNRARQPSACSRRRRSRRSRPAGRAWTSPVCSMARLRVRSMSSPSCNQRRTRCSRADSSSPTHRPAR